MIINLDINLESRPVGFAIQVEGIGVPSIRTNLAAAFNVMNEMLDQQGRDNIVKVRFERGTSAVDHIATENLLKESINSKASEEYFFAEIEYVQSINDLLTSSTAETIITGTDELPTEPITNNFKDWIDEEFKSIKHIFDHEESYSDRNDGDMVPIMFDIDGDHGNGEGQHLPYEDFMKQLMAMNIIGKEAIVSDVLGGRREIELSDVNTEVVMTNKQLIASTPGKYRSGKYKMMLALLVHIHHTTPLTIENIKTNKITIQKEYKDRDGNIKTTPQEIKLSKLMNRIQKELIGKTEMFADDEISTMISTMNSTTDWVISVKPERFIMQGAGKTWMSCHSTSNVYSGEYHHNSWKQLSADMVTIIAFKKNGDGIHFNSRVMIYVDTTNKRFSVGEKVYGDSVATTELSAYMESIGYEEADIDYFNRNSSRTNSKSWKVYNDYDWNGEPNGITASDDIKHTTVGMSIPKTTRGLDTSILYKRESEVENA